MGLLDPLFGRRRQKDEEVYASVVMLLRSPSTLPDEALKAAADRAYREFEYVGAVAGTRTITVQTTVISIQSKNGFYFDPAQDKASAETNVFARAWAEHTAWLTVDLPQSLGKSKDLRIKSYAISLPLVEQLWDRNCTGLYLPAEGITAPSTGSYASSLKWFSENKQLRKALALNSR
jgi:hypothetical protein